MDAKTKNRLLGWISEDEYRNFLEFVEEIYLDDADLKILVARKCSNLYAALLPLVLAEDVAARRRQGNLSEWKNSYVKEYLSAHGDDVAWKNDIEKIGEMDMTAEYGNIILNASWGYGEQRDLFHAIADAKRVAGIV